MRKRPRAESASSASSSPQLPMAPLAALPSACLATVLRYLVGPSTAAARRETLYPEPFPLAHWHRALAAYAHVSHEWRAAAALLTAQVTRHVARFDVSAAVTRTVPTNEFSRFDRHVSASDLRLVMRSVVTMDDTTRDAPSETWFTLPHGHKDTAPLRGSGRVALFMDSVAIDWRVLLAPRASHLVRLDLMQTPLDCAQLGSVLLAASTACPLVRVLALPQQAARRYSEDTEKREDNLNELYGALQRWHRANGGLLHLRIPFGRFDENTAVRLLRALIAYCPDIEYLDGWQDSYKVDADGLAHCEAYWPAPAALWAAFWAKCTKLRAFHTVVMPFDDAYVNVLCPRGVETLVLAIDSAKARHFEVSRESLLLMASQFHGLKRLQLEVPFVRDDVWDPRVCIDDEFVRAVASSSPHLREFRLQCVDKRVLFSVGNQGVCRLAELEYLEVVELQRLQAFEVAMAINLLCLRANMDLAISFANGASEVWQLLRFLADAHANDDGTCARTCFSISLWSLAEGHTQSEGIRQDEVDALVERLSASNIQVHAHAKCASDQCRGAHIVNLAHLELAWNVHKSTSRVGSGRPNNSRLFDFPVCGRECVSDDSESFAQ